MAAFDRILSGIPELDIALDNIRLGDNVVWRVSDLDQFRLFMEPYVERAIEDKRNICLTGSRLLQWISIMSSRRKVRMHSMYSTVSRNFRPHGPRIL